MGKRKQSKTEDEVKGGVQKENVAAAPKKRPRLAKRTNRGRVNAAAAVQSQRTGASPLGVLNDDCLLHVLSFMDGPEQLLQQRAVSRHWSSLASSDPLWRPHFLRLFGPQVFDAADEERAWKGDKPVSRRFLYYADDEEEGRVNYARHAEDDEHPDWEYSDEETGESQNEVAPKKQKIRKQTKKESSKGARGGCGPMDDSSLQKSIEHVRRTLESTLGGAWCHRYIAACRLLPRLRLPHATDEVKREVARWCNGTEDEVVTLRHCTSRLAFCMVDLPHYPRGDVHYRLHRLAVLLSLLCINKHAPKPGDEIRIGYAGKSCTITLARFCYAFLHGKERELAEELDLLSPPPACPDRKEIPKTKATTTTTTKKEEGKKALGKSKDEVEDEDEDDDDDDDDDEVPRKPRRFGWREFKEPALSLNVAGDFTPFAFFLSGPYGQKTYPFDRTYPCLDDHEDIFGSASDIHASYCFRTPKRGWAPGFFNASFSWYSHAAISTFHDPTRRQILVIKALEKEMVW